MICAFINTNPLFQKIIAVNVSEIDKVIKFALVTTATIERNFKIDYLFRPYQSGHLTSISFRFLSLCSAVSSQLRNSSVFTQFHSDSSAATSCATRNTEPFRSWPGRIKEQDSINVCKRCAVKPVVDFGMRR